MTSPHVAFEIPVLRVGTWPASADYSTETIPGIPDFQFVAVALYDPVNYPGVDNYAGACVGLPSAGYPIIGVLQNNPILNDSADVWCEGITKAVLSATVTVNQLLKVDTNGKFLPATSGTFGVAMALSNGSSGDRIAVWLQNFGKQ